MDDLIQKVFHFSDQQKWLNILLIYAIKAIVGILILIIGFWIIKRIVHVIGLFFEKRKLELSVNRFLKTIIGWVLRALLVIFILNFIGIQTTSVIAIIGAIGLAIGLALQGTLTNFAGGVIILLFKPFKIGDIIEVQSKKGSVLEIQIFHTLITTTEKHVIIIPNSILSNGIIENYTGKHRRVIKK